MSIFERVKQFNWTIERKLVASFTAAILVGFLIMIGLQARDQRASLVDLEDDAAGQCHAHRLHGP